MDTNSSTTESTTTGAAANDPNSTLSQVQGEFGSALASADTNATQSIQVLHQVHQARLSLLMRTAASLKTQFGADDPRVKAAQSAVTGTSATVGRISMVRQQLATVVPQVPVNGWALQGHLFEAQSRKPLSGYTAFFVDSQNLYQETYGLAYTDESGYFQLSYAGSQAKASAHTAAPLFLQLANTKAQLIYRSTTAFQPASGSTAYQSVLVSSGSPPIGDPPAAIRAVAIPSRKKARTAAGTKAKKSS